MEIILAVAGVVIGVALTHFSYRLSTRESSKQVDKIKTILLKLPDEVAIALKEDSRQQLTVSQLKEIVDAAYKCKDCGDRMVEVDSGIGSGHWWKKNVCEKCGWTDYNYGREE